MKSKELYSILLVTLLAALIYGCGGSSSSDSQHPQATPKPTPSPTSSPAACNSPSLDSPYVSRDDTPEFYVFNTPGSTLDTHLYSDGSNVFVLVFDGLTTFGFSGVPTGAGTSCELVKASADYDNDGAFDETAEQFFSGCIRLENGGEFTFLEGRSRVDASEQFEERLLLLYNQVIYFNVFDSLGCDLTEPVHDSGFYEPLLHQLQAEINTL